MGSWGMHIISLMELIGIPKISLMTHYRPTSKG